jgi:hypothetical protein
VSEATGISCWPKQRDFQGDVWCFLSIKYLDLVIILNVKSKLKMVDGLQGGRGDNGVTRLNFNSSE